MILDDSKAFSPSVLASKTVSASSPTFSAKIHLDWTVRLPVCFVPLDFSRKAFWSLLCCCPEEDSDYGLASVYDYQVSTPA